MIRKQYITYQLACILFILVFFVFLFDTHSQSRKSIDSLKSLLENSKDSTRANILKQLLWEYRSLDTSCAINYGKQALHIADSLKLKYEKADILGRLGIIKRNQGDYSQALDYYFKSLDISQEYNFLSIKALNFNNIADIYNRLGIYDKALDYVNQGLSISKQIEDDYSLGYIYNIKGLIYKNTKILDSALHFFRISLNLRKDIKFLPGIAATYLNIGLTHDMLGNSDSSFIYFNRSLTNYLSNNDLSGIANVYKCLGNYYQRRDDFRNAIHYFEKSLSIIKKLGDLEIQLEAAEGLKEAYLKLGNVNEAFKYKEFASAIKDSIASYVYIEKITQLTENFKFEIKRNEQEIIRKQREEYLNQKIKFQKSRLNLLIITMIAMLVLIGIIIYYYIEKNKAFTILNAKNKEIDDLNKTKDKLFSIIAHDLRSPFNTIIGFSELLYKNMDSYPHAERMEMITHIYQISSNTYKTLDNLLNWAKTQTHQIKINKEQINTSKLLHEIVEEYIPIANSKSIKLSYNSKGGYTIKTDRNMIITVVRNLISNAIKYTNHNGYIQVFEVAKKDFIEIVVEDNGVGMSEDQTTALFNSNVNISTYGTAHEKGTGLGLVICREFINSLKGSIYVESKIGKGSKFKISLPRLSD